MFKKKEKYKRKLLKTYFLIINLIIATIAISFLIGYVDAACPPGSACSMSNSPNPTGGSSSDLSLSGWGTGQSLINTANNVNPSAINAPAGQSSTAGPTGGGSAPFDSEGGFASGGQPFGWQPGNTGANPGSAGGRVPAGGGQGLPAGASGGYGDIPGPSTGGVPGATPPTYPGSPGPGGPGGGQGGYGDIPGGYGVPGSPGTGGAISNYFTNWPTNLGQIAMAAGVGMLIGQFAGGKNGQMWGAIAGAAGMLAYQFAMQMELGGLNSGLIGIAVTAIIFILTYKKESTKIVEFQCLPWQSPIGGSDCEKCNDFGECGEYTCKSLGQACDLVNKGSKNQTCVWKNPYDVNSPTIEMISVTKGHHFVPFKTIRPPATGVEILIDGGKCIKAFTPLSFKFKTNEPAQCKIDYNLTTDPKTAFDSMGYYVGGDGTYMYNHTEKLSLPGNASINQADPTLKNDGTYTLYIRCQDANGNYNQDAFPVRFCVDPGPDTTPPVIVNTSIQSRSPIQFNRTNIPIEVYVNEPANCKWSKEDRAYENMEGNMSCDTNLWEMNYQETYTCRAKLTGIEDRKENIFYFRCLDKPDFPENERNPNKQSYKYIIIGTQPLNLLEIEPNETIRGATDLINITLYVRTDNGYKNGEAICLYSTTGKESDYIEFSQTGGNEHYQRQDLVPGKYKYYVKCVDLGGNAVYNQTSFVIENDKISPGVIRVYKESEQLKIITNEEAECSLSFKDCNFEIDIGIKMSSADYVNHFADWKTSKNSFIRCKDRYNNQPNPNVCTIIIRPTSFGQAMNMTIEL